MYYTASGFVTPVGGRLVHRLREDFMISLFHASTCFEHYVLIIRTSKLYYTASGIVTTVGDRPGAQVERGLCTGRPHGRTCLKRYTVIPRLFS